MVKVSDIVRIGPVIPVLAFDSVEEGEAVCRALYEGGVKVLEITLRTAAGLGVIERASRIADDIVVGVGTLTKPEEAAASKRAARSSACRRASRVSFIRPRSMRACRCCRAA